MEYERYIAEGNLEKVLLGFATPEEEAELNHYYDLFPGLDEERNDAERRIEKVVFMDAVLPPVHLKANVMQQIAKEVKEQQASSRYAKRNIRIATVEPPPGQIRVHVGWRIILIVLLSMISLSLLAAIFFSYLAGIR